MLTYGCLLGVLLVSSPLAARHTLRSGAAVGDSRVFRLRDSVVVEMRIDLAGMEVRSDRSVVLIPSLCDGERTIALPAVEVMGRRRALYYERNGSRTYARQPYRVVRTDRKAAQTVDYRVALPRAEWMDRLRLGVTEDLCGCGRTDPGRWVSLCEADVEFSPCLAYVTPRVEMPKSRELRGRAYLDFVVDRTEIDPTYRRNPEELARIHATVDTVYNDRDFGITRIFIEGYASPEDTYEHNTGLAKGRTRALKEYLKARYGFADSLFVTSFVPEDWGNLRRYVAESSLPDKKSLLELIDGGMEPDRKERTLRMRHPESYRILLKECYPGLRRTDYRIDYRIRGFDADEARELLRTRPEKLSLHEMFAVAQTCPAGGAEFAEVFETAARLYPDDPVVNLNLANVLLAGKKPEAALPYLEKAGDGAEAENARGVAAALLERYDEAERHLRRAAEAGLREAAENLRAIAGDGNSGRK